MNTVSLALITNNQSIADNFLEKLSPSITTQKFTYLANFIRDKSQTFSKVVLVLRKKEKEEEGLTEIDQIVLKSHLNNKKSIPYYLITQNIQVDSTIQALFARTFSGLLDFEEACQVIGTKPESIEEKEIFGIVSAQPKKPCLRILVVDDQELPRRAHSMALNGIFGNSADLQIETAVSKEDALSKYEPGKYALVLTDLSMPQGEEGLELAQQIREKDPKTPICLCTGGDIEAFKQKHPESSELFQKIIAKPFTPDKGAFLKDTLLRKPSLLDPPS